jgi:hypothetical protein
MLDRTLKSLIAVLLLAGALTGRSAATSRAGDHSSMISPTSAAPAAESAAHRRQREQHIEEGCRELPAAPLSPPPPVATCS